MRESGAQIACRWGWGGDFCNEDMQAPLSMAYKLYDSCNGEKQLYIVHGADHSENYRKDPGGYEKIVTKFIEERIERKDD